VLSIWSIVTLVGVTPGEHFQNQVESIPIQVMVRVGGFYECVEIITVPNLHRSHGNEDLCEDIQGAL
jgi:hypothetical protein